MGGDNSSENKEQDRYKNLKTAEIISETLLDWGVDTIFGLSTQNRSSGGGRRSSTTEKCKGQDLNAQA
ncbi:MAG: hypothetical protein DLM72_06005 [Candidatus Nitrosopolaris wilkensis]|nr:MAG: hypothetical protein DLM72_06005 [Candidatus Nitrosopolaris wilkensis]